jgi:hypothetical protein
MIIYDIIDNNEKHMITNLFLRVVSTYDALIFGLLIISNRTKNSEEPDPGQMRTCQRL